MMATGLASPSTPCFINDQCAYQLVANIDNNHLPNSEVQTTFHPLVNVYCFFEHNHKLVIQSALISVWFINTTIIFMLSKFSDQFKICINEFIYSLNFTNRKFYEFVFFFSLDNNMQATRHANNWSNDVCLTACYVIVSIF